ncbi:MAG TPA: UDP binding domain-containing protein, partial [Thermodesulfovibrionales bacterium]|nr:UDP binding domain-containing protein [Thermodesulfovibrionales bacterium]
LKKEKAKLRVYDPVAMDNARALFPDIVFCRDPYDAAKGGDALVIVTEWNQFRSLDLEKIKGLLRQPFFFDLRNIYEPEKMKRLGFRYFCVGRS